jgi:hypothetical protein
LDYFCSIKKLPKVKKTGREKSPNLVTLAASGGKSRLRSSCCVLKPFLKEKWKRERFTDKCQL